jgi:hypothetical protein
VAENSDPERFGRPFEPGKSGNPGGRPRLIREYQTWLLEHAYPKAQEALLACLCSSDEKVKMMAVKEVNDRLMGKPSITVTGEEGRPVEVNVGSDIIEIVRRLASERKSP